MKTRRRYLIISLAVFLTTLASADHLKSKTKIPPASASAPTSIPTSAGFCPIPASLDGDAAKVSKLATDITAACVTKPVLSHKLYLSPDEVRRYDSKTIGRLIVDRIHQGCEKSEYQKSGEKPVTDDSEVVMMVNNPILPSIAQVGGLKNQHQTASTNGCSCTDNRFQTEQEIAMLRLPYSAKGREILPKYASFSIARADYGPFTLPTQYGDVALVFNGDVKKRTTWTYSDSLTSTSGHYRGGASWLFPTDPKKSPDQLGNPYLTKTAGYEKKKNDDYKCMEYCEAQIWGDVSLQDVTYAMIQQGTPIPDSLKSLGIPVYEYGPAAAGGAYTRGKLLDAGDPTKIPAAPAVTRDWLESSAKTATVPVLQKILGNELYRFKTDGELLAEVKAVATPDPASASTPSYGYPAGSYTAAALSQPGDLAVAELATREKTPAITEALKERFKNGTPFQKQTALYGMSELPWSEIKSDVLAAGGDSDVSMQRLGVALAADHMDDKDAKSLIETAAKSTEEGVKEAAERAQAPSLCSDEPGLSIK